MESVWRASFDAPHVYRELTHQFIDARRGIDLCALCQVRISGGGEQANMPQDLLNDLEFYAGFN